MSSPSDELRDRALIRYAEWMERHHGVPPTRREFRDWCGLSSTSLVEYRLQVMEHDGLLMHAVPSRGAAAANDLVLTPLGALYLVRLREEGVTA